MHKKVLLRRRHGVVILYVVLALVVLLGAAGMSIDMGNLYLQRDRAQRAADAAALAGALQLMDGKSLKAANMEAKRLAKANGFDPATDTTYSSQLDPDGNHPTWFKVTVSKPIPTYFMAVFGFNFKTVGASATSTYQTPVDIDINGGGEYGKNGPVTLSMFGPYARHSYGDNYSPMYLNNGNPNPQYKSVGQYGYNFKLSIPQNYASVNGTSKVDLQIFDPDTNNTNGSDDASSAGNGSIDEIRYPPGGNPKHSTVDGTADYDGARTTTRFRLYDTKGTDKESDDTLIATAIYKNQTYSDMKWVTPDGFTLDLNDSRWASRFNGGSKPVTFRMNIKSINGSSENGFNLRAGPPPANPGTTTRVDNSHTPPNIQYKYDGTWHDNPQSFNPDNGTSITATGRIPMNFNSSGTATIHLGMVAQNATQVTITKFDTDVGARSVVYTDGNGNSWTGKLSGNDKFETDVFDLPANYPGGDWSATYRAGKGDTSVWDMHYTGPRLSNPGGVRLVR